MTGYGRGTAERGGRRVTIELRSVNHRFFDVKVRGVSLPPAVEDALSSRLRARLERGAITVSVRLERGGSVGLTIDGEAARVAFATLRALADDLGTLPPGIDLVVAQPGVVISHDVADDGELALAATAALDAALDALIAMRGTEGAALAREIAARTRALHALVGEIAELAGRVPGDLQRRLHERIRRLLDDAANLTLDPTRLAQEVALLVDRADVTEEVVRLRSHLDQLAGVAEEGAAAVGRRMDFLLQEIGRELNTIGSKSPSSDIINRVLAAKVDLEKLREQAHNVE